MLLWHKTDVESDTLHLLITHYVIRMATHWLSYEYLYFTGAWTLGSLALLHLYFKTLRCNITGLKSDLKENPHTNWNEKEIEVYVKGEQVEKIQKWSRKWDNMGPRGAHVMKPGLRQRQPKAAETPHRDTTITPDVITTLRASTGGPWFWPLSPPAPALMSVLTGLTAGHWLPVRALPKVRFYNLSGHQMLHLESAASEVSNHREPSYRQQKPIHAPGPGGLHPAQGQIAWALEIPNSQDDKNLIPLPRVRGGWQSPALLSACARTLKEWRLLLIRSVCNKTSQMRGSFALTLASQLNAAPMTEEK